MKNIRSHIAACALAAGLAAAAHAQPLPSTTPTAAGFSPEGLERLDRFFAREIEAKRVPGADGIACSSGVICLEKTQ